ncbi:hypothetical protein C5614_29680 [Massilia phosphatilytica]|nr:hypothetical protein C5614_29680 [Massilia phosphatilytica]
MLFSPTTGSIVNRYRIRLAATLSCALVIGATQLCHAADAADAADAGGRQAAIARIVKAQLGATILTPDLPVLHDTPRYVRQLNPGLTDAQWRDVLNEVAGRLADGMNRPDSPMFAAYRTVLEPLSDAELAQLERILADPVYRKFAGALTSRPGQQALMHGLVESTPWINETVSTVLKKHGLKERE